MTKNLFLFSLLLSNVLSTKAQDSDLKKNDKPVKFGKIDPTEFDHKPEYSQPDKGKPKLIEEVKLK